MGTLFGFIVGFVIGARMGADGFDDVVRSYRDIRQSAEFNSFVDIMGHHARATAGRAAERLINPPEELSTLEKARLRTEG